MFNKIMIVMYSMEFKIVMTVISVLLLLFLIGYVIYMILDAREKCPQCGSHNIKDVNRKSNKITRKCNKCGHKFYVYESFY